MRCRVIYQHWMSCLVYGVFSSWLIAQTQLPLNRLPKEVAFQTGKLSLFLEKRDDGSLSIFVINDSGVDQEFDAEDGDIYLKQEAKIFIFSLTRSRAMYQ